MAIEKFIPELWSSAILAELRPNYVYADLFNRNYEGMIRQSGDTVHITSISAVQVSDYVEGTTKLEYQTLSDTEQTLVIDQAKSYAFDVPDIQKAQAAGDFVAEASRTAADSLLAAVDGFVSKRIADGMDAGNKLKVTITAEMNTAYETLVDLGTKLTLANVPLNGRVAVVTPEFYGLLQKDQRFVATGDAKAAGVRENGVIGSAAGMQIRVSNAAPRGAAAASKLVIAGVAGLGGTFAEQILKTESGRHIDRFADWVRGLHVYGAKVTRPKAWAAADVTISAAAPSSS